MPTYKFTSPHAVIFVEAREMVTAIRMFQFNVKNPANFKFELYSPKNLISYNSIKSPLQPIIKKSTGNVLQIG